MEDELSEVGEKGKEVTKEEKKLLYERVEELKRSNASLLAENDVFERFISRLDPRDLMPQPAGEGLGGAGASQLEVGGRGRRQRTQSTTPDRLQQLTLAQKCFLAQREAEETQEQLEKLKLRYERIQDNYKATLEEAEIRLTEIRKANCEFERDMAKPLREQKGEMMGGEKVLHYVEDKMKRKDTQVEKLRLKNQALKAQGRKLQLQLRQRKEMEETLNEAEFQQYREQIDDEDQDLLQVKKIVGNAQQVLSSYKKKLQSVTSESTQLSSDITKRKEMLAKIEEESQQAEEERLKAEAINQNLRSQLTEYTVPDILEYIQVKDKHKKLQHSLQTWERKVEIGKMVLKTDTKAWNKQGTLSAAKNAEAGARSGACQPPVKLPNIAQPWSSPRRPSK